VILRPGFGGTNGNVILLNVPDADPGVTGGIWHIAGVLHINTG
jgi:hypothetical protein